MKLLLAGFLTILSFSIVEARKIPGIITFKDQRVQEVILDIPINICMQEPNYVFMQDKVKILDAEGKRVRISPQEAAEVQFDFQGEEIKLVSRKVEVVTATMESRVSRFLKLEQDGLIQLFRFYNYIPSNGFDEARVTRLVIQNQGTEAKILRNRNNKMKEQLMEFLKEYPNLIAQIEQEDFRPKRDLANLIRRYNSNS